MKRFESIKVGDFAELSHLITQQDINHFVELTGDDNKLHVDKDYAGRTSLKKTVAHGMLGASFISTVIGTKLPGDGALWFAQNLEFLLPVRIGDTITVRVVVTKKDERTFTLELTTDIFNQNKQKVTTGTAKVKIIEEEQPQKKEQIKTKKVALVIGATGGIGRATCQQLVKDGFDVAIHYYKNKDLAHKIKEELSSSGKNTIIVNANITDPTAVQNMVNEVTRKFDVITTVVNASTVNIPNIKFKDLDWNTLQEQLDINIKGTFNLLKAIVPIMEANKYGKIITIVTQYIEKPVVELSHYIAAKSALSGFMKALAFELAPKGICINLVSPGITRTELTANIPEKVKLLTEAQTPLRRIAEPEDVANAISFLASERSDFLAGETIRINGGQVML